MQLSLTPCASGNDENIYVLKLPTHLNTLNMQCHLDVPPQDSTVAHGQHHFQYQVSL